MSQHQQHRRHHQQQREPTSLLTSTTAPGKVFVTREELANHYKSDWHRYNLKRREAGLPLLEKDDFKARLEAALALRREREGKEERTGTDHLKGGKEGRKNKQKKTATTTTKEQEKKKKNRGRNVGGVDASDGGGVVMLEQAGAWQRMKKEEKEEQLHQHDDHEGKERDKVGDEAEPMEHEEQEEEEKEAPIIDPRQCLFSSHTSSTVEQNVEHMKVIYGFFIPDMEYLVDLEGLIGYCAEKIKLGHYCLYCQRIFKTWQGCQKHMISTRHTKIRYEAGIDMDEFDPFYDFTEADAEFLGVSADKLRQGKKDSTMKKKGGLTKGLGEDEEMSYEVVEGDDDDESGEWEDISDDDNAPGNEEKIQDEDDDDDDDLFDGYKDEIAQHGFDVTPLGELIFPDGRIVGHRGLARYYKQRFAPDSSDRAAVVAARRSAGERVYNGRVYDTRGPSEITTGSHETALTLAKAGLSAGAAQGRAGKGILVPTGTIGGGSRTSGFTALSLYRYRAVVKKARLDDARGRRLEQKTKNNINRMDKKANRLMNGVSVAHAAR